MILPAWVPWMCAFTRKTGRRAIVVCASRALACHLGAGVAGAHTGCEGGKGGRWKGGRWKVTKEERGRRFPILRVLAHKTPSIWQTGAGLRPIHRPQVFVPMTSHRPVLLVVDDEAIVRHTVSRAGRDAGFEVISCPGPTDATEELARRPVDMAIVDLRMPGATG